MLPWKLPLRARALLSLSSTFALAACASGPRLIMGQPITKQVAVVLRVESDAEGDEFGGIAAIADTVTDGLTKRGIPNQLYAADDEHPGTPRIEIWVSKWTASDQGAETAGRLVGGLVGTAIEGAASGDYQVVVKVFREGDKTPVCVRKDSGDVDAGNASGVVSLGESIGDWVLSTALRETKDCED